MLFAGIKSSIGELVVQVKHLMLHYSKYARVTFWYFCIRQFVPLFILVVWGVLSSVDW